MPTFWMASGYFLLLGGDRIHSQKDLAIIKFCKHRRLWVCFQKCSSREEALWLKGCYMFRKALGMFSCLFLFLFFKIRLLYSRCLLKCLRCIQHRHMARIYAYIWASEPELNWIGAQIPIVAAQNDESITRSNHFLLTARWGDLGLKRHI